ncbi:MAG: hypothetical protein ACYDG2_17365 [Ruminiclostridium sp.]
MKIYVGVTDNNWYNYLSNIQPPDEVNFWQPSGKHLRIKIVGLIEKLNLTRKLGVSF